MSSVTSYSRQWPSFISVIAVMTVMLALSVTRCQAHEDSAVGEVLSRAKRFRMPANATPDRVVILPPTQGVMCRQFCALCGYGDGLTCAKYRRCGPLKCSRAAILKLLKKVSAHTSSGNVDEDGSTENVPSDKKVSYDDVNIRKHTTLV